MTAPTPDDRTPRQIVRQLDQHIIGQKNAKRAVAIALRNRWRRQRVSPELRNEISPKNIILIGPTGVGKTEVARRLAALAHAPFLKVEASKFTEVGYVGRDVESMIRDLVEVAIGLVRLEEEERVRERAQRAAEDRALDLLPLELRTSALDDHLRDLRNSPSGFATKRVSAAELDTLREKLRNGEFDDVIVEVEVTPSKGSAVQIFTGKGSLDELDMGDMLGSLFPNQTSRKKLPLKDALPILQSQESTSMIDMDRVRRDALLRAQDDGIIFLDEIDKIAGSGSSSSSPDVSRQGVQRDLLPIVEGSRVRTKHGVVQTDHILFIAAGAFHVAKPSDLIPELQGRFPIRVELENLTRDDFARILTEPHNSLVSQYTAMMATEGIDLSFTPDAIQEIASIAAHVNDTVENIGARRLHTVMERLLDDLSFKAPELLDKHVTIQRSTVRETLSEIAQDTDLSRYIL